MAAPTENRRGIALMLLAMACYVANDALIKLAAPHCTAGQILLLRGVCASAIVLALAIPARALATWRAGLRPIVGLRVLLEVSTALTSVLALARIPLATVTALMMSAPLIVTALSMASGMEPRRMGRIVATALGFAGVLMVLQPAAQSSDPGSGPGLLLALACTASLAAREWVNRRVPTQVPSLLLAVLTTAAVTAAGGLMAAAEPWRSPATTNALAWIAGAAVFTAIGNYAVIAATRRADLSAVAPFRYSAIVWALLLGYLLWNDTPDRMAWIGILLIVGSGAGMLRALNLPPARPTSRGQGSK
ncbi:DMT family transporter [Variovorax sp. LARHSF232]